MTPPVFKTALAALVLIAATAHACLWDGDTLASERARFPGIGILISGSFARHSREFHEWRIAQRQKDIAAAPAVASPTLAAHYDDLAVSQHKLGDHQAAIATLLKKDKLMPGQYETYSNLGTFYIYTGELQKALKTIDQALAINPNAHFGREKYQKWLVLWILEKQEHAASQDSYSPFAAEDLHHFSRIVAQQEAGGAPLDTEQEVTLSHAQRSAAIRGVAGMMWFADYDNPHLQEALGDLLLSGDIGDNAANLASLCYMHATLKAIDPAEKARLTEKCEMSGHGMRGFDIQGVKKNLLAALTKGAEYNETVRQDELKWIAEGLNADVEFQKKYLVPLEKK